MQEELKVSSVVSRRLNRYLGRPGDEPETENPAEPSPPSGSASQVAILLKGAGSDSRDKTLETVDRSFGRSHSVGIFSYADVFKPYRSESTYKPIPELAALLTEHLGYFPKAEHFCLVGYSLGGVLLSYWLTREGKQFLDQISGVVFIAAPVWINTFPAVDYPRNVHRVLEDFHFDWQTFRQEVLSKVRFLALRCEFDKDRFFEDRFITFARVGFDVEEIGIPGSNHFDIGRSERTLEVLDKWLVQSWHR